MQREPRVIVPPTSLPAGENLARPQKPLRHFAFSAARLAAGMAILVYLAKSGVISFAALSKLIIEWPLTVAAMAIFLVDIFLMALRTTWLFRPLGMKLTFGKSVQLTLGSIFFSTFLPGAGGGDIVKLYYATKTNAGRRTEVATVLLFDRVIGFFAMLILPFFFVPLFLPLLQAAPLLRTILFLISGISVAILAVFLFCVFHKGPVRFLARESLALPKWRKLVSRVLETICSYRRTPGTLIGALLLSLFANLSVIASTVLAVLPLDPAGRSSRMFLAVPIAQAVNGLPLTPGGL